MFFNVIYTKCNLVTSSDITMLLPEKKSFKTHILHQQAEQSTENSSLTSYMWELQMVEKTSSSIRTSYSQVCLGSSSQDEKLSLSTCLKIAQRGLKEGIKSFFKPPLNYL